MIKIRHTYLLATVPLLFSCGEDDKKSTTTEETPVVVASSSGTTTVAATEVTLEALLKVIKTSLESARSKDANLLRGGGNQSSAAEPTTSDTDDPYCDSSGNPISAVAANNTSTTNSRSVVSSTANIYPAAHSYCLFSPSDKVAYSIYDFHNTAAVYLCLLGTTNYDGVKTTKVYTYSADLKSCLGSSYDSRNDGQVWGLTYTATKIGNPLDIAAKGGFNHKIEIEFTINSSPVMSSIIAYKTRSDALMFAAFNQDQGEDGGEAYVFSFDPAAGTLHYEYYQPMITYTNSFGYSRHIRAKVDGKWDLTNGFTEVTGFGLISSNYNDYSESLKNTAVDPANPRTSAWGIQRSIAGDFKSGLVSRNYLISCTHGQTCDPKKKDSYRDLTGVTGYCNIQNGVYQCPATAGVPMATDADTDFISFGASPLSAKAWFNTLAAPLSFTALKSTATP